MEKGTWKVNANGELVKVATPTKPTPKPAPAEPRLYTGFYL